MLLNAIHTILSDEITCEIYKQWLPQDSILPAITLTIISDRPVDGLCRSTFRARVQIDVWSFDVDEVNEISNQVFDLLELYSGTVEETEIVMAEFHEGGERNEPPKDGSDSPTFRYSQDYFIRYKK